MLTSDQFYSYIEESDENIFNHPQINYLDTENHNQGNQIIYQNHDQDFQEDDQVQYDPDM